jgi:hypothetical protein
MTGRPPVAWKPPTWTATWQPHGPNGNKRWRFSIRDAGGTEIWSLATEICAEDDHPGSHPWRGMVSVAAVPGEDWQPHGDRWSRAVFPITPDAEREILAGAGPPQ